MTSALGVDLEAAQVDVGEVELARQRLGDLRRARHVHLDQDLAQLLARLLHLLPEGGFDLDRRGDLHLLEDLAEEFTLLGHARKIMHQHERRVKQN